jgi:hypothetical protein
MEELKSLNLIYEETKAKIERQFQTLEALDNKAGIIAGLTGIILGIIVTAKPSNRLFWYLAAIFLFLSSILSLFGILVKKWRSDPSPLGMKTYLDKEEIISKRQFFENLIGSYRENKRKIVRKARWIKFSIIALILGLIVVLILVFVN